MCAIRMFWISEKSICILEMHDVFIWLNMYGCFKNKDIHYDRDTFFTCFKLAATRI